MITQIVRFDRASYDSDLDFEIFVLCVNQDLAKLIAVGIEVISMQFVKTHDFEGFVAFVKK